MGQTSDSLWKKMSQEEQLMEFMEARERDLKDRRTNEAFAKERGFAQGFAESFAESFAKRFPEDNERGQADIQRKISLATARAMLEKNISTDLIAKYTDCTQEDILALRKTYGPV